MTDLEQWTEAVARAICDAGSGCVCLSTETPCEDRLIQARAAVLALAPLVIERCAQEAEQFRGRPVGAGDGDTYVPSPVYGPHVATAIRALKTAITEAGRGKEASDV